MSHATQPETSNRRQAVRKPTRNLAYIVLSTRSELECLLVDISRSGARLMLSAGAAKPFQPPVHVPAAFVLYLSNDHTEIDCELTWRNGDALGVQFRSGFRRALVRR